MINVLLAAVAAVSLTGGADGGLDLRASTGAERLVAGQPVPITLIVTRGGRGGCGFLVLAAGMVRGTESTRDGATVMPDYLDSYYLISPQRQAETSAQVVPAGGSLTITTELETVDALPGGTGIVSHWSADVPGRYRASFVYTAPHRECPGVTNIATVEFTVADKPGLPLWWIVAAITVLLGFAVWLIVIRRRAGATVALLVLATLVAVPKPARAEVTVGPDDIGLSVALNQCRAIYESKGGDPSGVWAAVGKKGTKPSIRLKPWRSIDKSDSYVVDKDGNQVIYWNPDDKQLLEPGIPAEKCADLYHEMAHARDYKEKGKMDKRPCDNLFVETSEASATFAENAYRASRKPPLLTRRTYSGLTLPQKLEDCEKRPQTAKKPPNACDSAAGLLPAGCDKDLPPDPQQGRPGMSNGDPHLVTLDGRAYDFQAVGEFVAAESGDLVIQTRQSPVAGSRIASLNAAVAMKVGADKLQFASAEGTVKVWRNGTPEIWEPGAKTLSGGGKAGRRPSSIGFNQDGYTIRWPDGSLAWVDPVGPYGLRLFVVLADAHRGKVRGLLGDFDGDPANDVSTADLYTSFADGVRVTDATSLFVYGAGENTAKFTDRSFPDRVVTAADLDPAQRERARRICEAAGLTDPVQLDACVIDVAVTGQPAWAVNSYYASTQVVATPAPTNTYTGEITADGQVLRFEVVMVGGKDFFLADWRGATDACDQVFMINLAGVSHGHSPCSGQAVRFTVPEEGKPYQIEVSSPRNGRGSFSFEILKVDRRAFLAKLGERFESSLVERAQEDVVEFEPDGAGAVRLTGLPECARDFFADLYDITEQRVVSAGWALCGEVRFRLDNPSHRYAVVVSNAKLKTGDYTFTVQRATPP